MCHTRINVHDPKVLGVVLDALVGVIGCVEAVVVHVIVGVVCYDVVIPVQRVTEHEVNIENS